MLLDMITRLVLFVALLGLLAADAEAARRGGARAGHGGALLHRGAPPSGIAQHSGETRASSRMCRTNCNAPSVDAVRAGLKAKPGTRERFRAELCQPLPSSMQDDCMTRD